MPIRGIRGSRISCRGHDTTMEAFCGQPPKFFLDAMLGRLNKWLRVLGYDAICRHILDQDQGPPHFKDGRILLTRHRERAQRFDRVLFLRENHVGNQLAEMRSKLGIDPDRPHWFSRCLICNTPLVKAPEEVIKENVPDHVYHENSSNIHFCPSCGRCYWPGTHRNRMEKQLGDWGF